MAEKNKVKVVEELVQQLLDLLGIKTSCKVEEKNETLNINFYSESPGILIGYHGETLSALQLILMMMTYKKLGEWVRLLVNVGDYRQRRQETLERMALSIAQKVKFSHLAQALPPMSSFERRIVHLALTGDPEVETTSEGEAPQRRVVVKPKDVSGTN